MANRFMRAFDGTLRSIPESYFVEARLTSASVDQAIYIAGHPCEVISVREIHSGDGAASSTLDIKKCVGVVAPASGTTVLSSTFALDSTSNTLVSKTPASGLTATLADRKLDTGNVLAIDLTGTISSLVGLVVIELRKLQSARGPV